MRVQQEAGSEKKIPLYLPLEKGEREGFTGELGVAGEALTIADCRLQIEDSKSSILNLKSAMRKGGKTMSKKNVAAGLLSRLAVGLVGVVGMLVSGLVLVERAEAVQFSTNNATALTVRITPNVDRGVEISSGGVNLNLGIVDLGVSTKTVSPATVTIMGNMSRTELNMTSTVTVVAAGEDSWDFANTPGTDLMVAQVVFTSVTYSGVPSNADFDASSSTIESGMAPLSASGKRIGAPGGNGIRFEHASGGADVDMDNMAPATRRGMWVRLQTPTVTSSAEEQILTIQLNVATSNY